MKADLAEGEEASEVVFVGVVRTSMAEAEIAWTVVGTECRGSRNAVAREVVLLW